MFKHLSWFTKRPDIKKNIYISSKSLNSDPSFITKTANLFVSKGFGSTREQAHFTPRRHWEAGVTAGKAILNSTPDNREMSVHERYSSSTIVLFFVSSDSESGEELFKSTAGRYRGSATSPDAQFEGYDAYCVLLAPMNERTHAGRMALVMFSYITLYLYR